MINKILHTVTNRKNFVSPVFPSTTKFEPTSQAPTPTAVRELLQLPFTPHDYFVVGALQAADAVPDIRWDFQEEQRTYDLRHYRKPVGWSTGADLVGSVYGPPLINRVADEWPVFFDIYGSYVDAGHLRVTGGSHSDIVRATSSDGQLLVEWPEWTGIQGNLANLDPGWTSVFVWHLYHVPANYPYRKVAEVLTESTEANQLLTGQGLMAQFASAQTAVEKVALTTLALSKSYHG